MQIPVKHRQSVLLGITAWLFFVSILLWLGRSFWSDSGFGWWTWEAAGMDTSQFFGDPYSFSHYLHGIIFFWIIKLVFKKWTYAQAFLAAMVLEMGWEVLENSPIIIDRYRNETAALEYYGDSIWNAAGDVVFCMLGFYVASKLRWYWSVAMFLALELIMLVTIRDNLTLNVIMLLYPIDAIKDWQLNVQPSVDAASILQ